jgi:hypothetical protein
MLMSFNSKDLLVSILPSQDTATVCPEFTIPPTGCGTVSTAADSAESDGLMLLRGQLRTVLAQPPI